MRKYIYIFIANFQMTLAYKLNLVTSVISNFVTIIISFFLWKAVYKGSEMQSIGGYTENQMLKYIIFVNLLTLVFSFDSVVRLGGLVRSGKLTTMILRPISMLGEFLASFIGQKMIYILLLTCFFLFTFITQKGLFLLSLIYIVVSFFLFFLLMATLANIGFWLIQMWPLRPVISGVYMLMGGLFFPLSLLPKGVYMLVQYNPFAFFGFHIANVLQGMYQFGELVKLICIGCFWIFGLYFLYKISLKHGLKKYEGMGA